MANLIAPGRARTALVPLAVAASLALGACGGQSAEDKAQAQVCGARVDIQKQLDKLQGLTLTTASIATVQQSLGAIGEDLKAIGDAQSDLSGQRRQAAATAAQQFGSQLSTIAGNLAAGVASGSQAKAQVQAAFSQLEQSFRAAFKPVDC